MRISLVDIRNSSDFCINEEIVEVNRPSRRWGEINNK